MFQSILHRLIHVPEHPVRLRQVLWSVAGILSSTPCSDQRLLRCGYYLLSLHWRVSFQHHLYPVSIQVSAVQSQVRHRVLTVKLLAHHVLPLRQVWYILLLLLCVSYNPPHRPVPYCDISLRVQSSCPGDLFRSTTVHVHDHRPHP